MGRASGTAKLSRALKSTSKLQNKKEPAPAFMRARDLEERVLQASLKRGAKLVSRNLQIAGVEVDLLLEKEGVLHLIEIKSLQSLAYLERRVTPAQRERLRRALRALLEQGHQARAHLALVLPDRIKLLTDFFVEG